MKKPKETISKLLEGLEVAEKKQQPLLDGFLNVIHENIDVSNSHESFIAFTSCIELACALAMAVHGHERVEEIKYMHNDLFNVYLEHAALMEKELKD